MCFFTFIYLGFVTSFHLLVALHRLASLTLFLYCTFVTCPFKFLQHHMSTWACTGLAKSPFFFFFCNLLLLQGTSPCRSRGKSCGGRWQRDLSAEEFPARSTAGHLWGSTGMPLDLFWLLCTAHSLGRRIPAAPAPVQSSVPLDGIEMIPFFSIFNLKLFQLSVMA